MTDELELYKELTSLVKIKKVLEEELLMTKNKVFQLENDISMFKTEIKSYKDKLSYEKKLYKSFEQKYENKLKQAENNIRKNSFFNQKCKGLTKNKSYELVLEQVDKEKHKNSVLVNFIKKLAEKLNFDNDLLTDLFNVCESVEDESLKIFIDYITKKNKN